MLNNQGCKSAVSSLSGKNETQFIWALNLKANWEGRRLLFPNYNLRVMETVYI